MCVCVCVCVCCTGVHKSQGFIWCVFVSCWLHPHPPFLTFIIDCNRRPIILCGFWHRFSITSWVLCWRIVCWWGGGGGGSDGIRGQCIWWATYERCHTNGWLCASVYRRVYMADCINVEINPIVYFYLSLAGSGWMCGVCEWERERESCVWVYITTTNRGQSSGVVWTGRWAGLSFPIPFFPPSLISHTVSLDEKHQERKTRACSVYRFIWGIFAGENQHTKELITAGNEISPDKNRYLRG